MNRPHNTSGTALGGGSNAAGPSTWILPFAYAALYIGWGTTYLAIRVGVQSFEPATFMCIRFLSAAAILLPIVLLSRSWKGTRISDYIHSALQGILLLVCGLLPVAYAEKSLPSNITAIIIGCTPVAFALFDRILNGTPIRKPVFVGFIFGFLGILLLGINGPASGAVTFASLVLVMSGFLCWSFGSVLSKRLRPIKAPLLHVCVQYSAAGVLLFGFAFFLEGLNGTALRSVSRASWESLAYITLFPSLISYTSYMWLLKHEPMSRVSTYAFVNPVVAVIAGALILDESASATVLVSLALVLLGTWFNFRKPHKLAYKNGSPETSARL